MTFTNVLENLSIVEMQSRQLDSTVSDDAEEAGNWGNQIESKQSFLFYSVPSWEQFISNGVAFSVHNMPFKHLFYHLCACISLYHRPLHCTMQSWWKAIWMLWNTLLRIKQMSMAKMMKMLVHSQILEHKYIGSTKYKLKLYSIERAINL